MANNDKTPAIRFKGFTDAWEQRKLSEISDVRDGTHDSPSYLSEGHPFVTSKNAITGGELQNIHNGVDGVVMEEENQLVEVIKDIADNKSKYVEMGRMAQSYYNENRTPKHMAEGLWNAITYAIEH